MDVQAQRKRAFSQAFQLINQTRLVNNHLQPAKRVSHHPLDSNQENEAPSTRISTLEQTPGTQVRHPKPDGLGYTKNTPYSYALLRYELFGIEVGPESSLTTDVDLPPVLRGGHFDTPELPDSLSTPQIVRGQSMFGPSPYVRPDVSLSIGDKASEQTQSRDFLMTDAPVDLLTPSALGFDNLSLNSHESSMNASPIRREDQYCRTRVRIVPISSMKMYVILRQLVFNAIADKTAATSRRSGPTR